MIDFYEFCLNFEDDKGWKEKAIFKVDNKGFLKNEEGGEE